MRSVLLNLIDIFDQHDIDWMGFQQSSKNKYTYHHIVEKKNKGELSIDNGAILTNYAHKLLNVLSEKCPKAYDDYQKLFRYINNTKKPIDNDILEDIYGMMLDTFYYQDYGDTSQILIDKHGLQKTYKKTK